MPSPHRRSIVGRGLVRSKPLLCCPRPATIFRRRLPWARSGRCSAVVSGCSRPRPLGGLRFDFRSPRRPAPPRRPRRPLAHLTTVSRARIAKIAQGALQLSACSPLDQQRRSTSTAARACRASSSHLFRRCTYGSGAGSRIFLSSARSMASMAHGSWRERPSWARAARAAREGERHGALWRPARAPTVPALAHLFLRLQVIRGNLLSSATASRPERGSGERESAAGSGERGGRAPFRARGGNGDELSRCGRRTVSVYVLCDPLKLEGRVDPKARAEATAALALFAHSRSNPLALLSRLASSHNT